MSGSRPEDRLRRLQRVSLDLNAAMSLDDVAAAVVEALDAPGAAPSRGLYLLDADGEYLVLRAQRGFPPEAAAAFARLPLSDDVPGSIAVRERRTVISTAVAEAAVTFEPLRDVPRSTTGFAAIPLIGEQACVGVLAIGFNGGLVDADVEYMEAVAAQVAQAVIRVGLLDRERRRRAELEFLAHLTETALAATDHVDLMRRVCAAAVPMLGDWCCLYFLGETDVTPEVAFAHVDPDQQVYVEELMRRYPFDPDRPVGPPAVIRTGVTEYVPRLTSRVVGEAIEASGLDPDEALGILDRLAITSVITVALRTRRRIAGAMQFVSAESRRRYDSGDVALAEAVAGRLAEALESAWAADHQRSVALALQRALLPPALPSIPGVDLAARYWPAGIDDVGGDFYDVFETGDGEWAVVIGDVCGTGPDAAAMTSIARHTIRAAARHGASPAVVMEWLNQAVRTSHRDRFCTVCFATLRTDGSTWHLTSSAAGHPLPIVSTPSGTSPRGLPGTLVGLFDSVAVHPEETSLTSGDVVVLYTDGITDLPSPYGIDAGELAAIVERHRGLSAGAIADAIHRSLVDRVPDRRRRDDAAVIVLTIGPPSTA